MPAENDTRSCLNPFRPPFRGLTAIVLCFFVLCFFVHPQSSIRSGALNDPDSAMYLAQTLNLVDGQGWYDRVEHRLDPPQGVLMHFSRIAELPYALIIAPMQPVLGRVPSALLASIVWPPLFLLGLMLVLRRQASLFIPQSWAGLTAFTTIFAQDLTYEYMPGRAGHRGLVPIFVSLAVLCLAQLILNPRSWRWGVVAGCALAMALSFSIEGLPWVLLLSSAIGFWASAQGGEAPARGGLAFGGGLVGAGMILLALYRLPAQWFLIDFISLSYVYIVLLLGIAACFIVIWATRKLPDAKGRLCAAAGAALLIGGVFLLSFPRLLAGPYGDVNSRLFHLMMFNITEAVPLYKKVHLSTFLFRDMPWPVASLIVCAWQIRKNVGAKRWLWSGFAFLQTAALVLAAAYQSRCCDYMQLFGIVPLTVLLHHGLDNLGKAQKMDPVLRRVIVIAAIALVPVLSLGFNAVTARVTPVDVVLFPMQSFPQPCRDVRAAAAVLNSPAYDDGKPKLIINAMSEGPGLLLYTHHNVLAAPYPMDVTGNLDALDFFHATDMQTATRIANNRGADFIMSCKYVESGYLVPEDAEPDFYTKGYFDVPNPPPLAFRMMRGNAPEWLTPVEPDKTGITLLYEIR